MADEAVRYRSTIDLLQSHASVRRFTNEPLNNELLEALLDAGMCASTSSNMQARTVISVSDPARKLRLAELCSDQQQIHESAAFLVFCADMHRLTLCAEKHGETDYDLGLTESLVTALVDTALVMQNFAIAAESTGLGICMIGAMRNNPFEIRELLRLPDHVFAVAGMCVGWPAKNMEPKPRLPLEAVWHREHYRTDEELTPLIDAYDGILASFNDSMGMHTSDSRWSAVMAKRLGEMRKREAVGRFLREQGLNTQRG